MPTRAATNDYRFHVFINLSVVFSLKCLVCSMSPKMSSLLSQKTEKTRQYSHLGKLNQCILPIGPKKYLKDYRNEIVANY